LNSIPLPWRIGAALALGLAAIAFLATPLVFGPVPWADGSAFYLPALELVHWPPAWRMHAQAAFVPSYDQANFNLMPGLPLLLGLVARSGLLHLFEPQLLIRIVSVAGLLAWAGLLWKWLLETTDRRAWIAASLIALAALWDPVLRWGTLVVRTETWVGLCWLWILRELHRWERSGDSPQAWNRSAWRISAGLALAAYFHFEAAFIIPATIVGLGFSSGWLKRLCGIAGRTSLLLSPWILYVLLHFPLFVEQMQVQFFRLSHGNPRMGSAYAIFHSLFVELGSPAGSPKFFNVGKGIFWLGVFALLGLSAFRAWGSSWKLPRDRALIASAVAFASCFYLWASKDEAWFITLCHLMLWPWAGCALIASLQGGWGAGPRRGIAGLAGAYAAISVLASVGQARAISPGYSWAAYQAWIDCVEQAVTTSELGQKPGLKLWQPHVPDLLVELSRRRPGWDLTRALDFPSRTDLAIEAGLRMDAIVFSRSFNPAPPLPAGYAGGLRDRDRDILSRGEDVAFGPWALEALLGKDAARWEPRVCETGPFWAAVFLKRATGS
jgi:hypothetical protein